MKKFMCDNFLLESDSAERLYHDFAEQQPIIDYHCHLSPRDICENRTFDNLYEIWLAGDHYKWRAMRSNGIEEKYCTGSADPYEKYLAFVKTLPFALRNPLFHWSHLELKRYFNISDVLSEKNAREIWDKANALLETEELSAHGILKKFNVEVICTTDDPTDNLAYHRKIAELNIGTKVLPTFRPDKSMMVDDAPSFNLWTDSLGEAANIDISNLENFKEALNQRHSFFHSCGGRISDHGLPYCYTLDCSETEASGIFDAVRSGKNVPGEQKEKFASYLMHFFGILDSDRGWVKQIHVGAQRNNNTICFKKGGADIGYDSIGDYPQSQELARYLDKLNSLGKLPKTILYNLNPKDNYLMGTMIGNFQEGPVPGKIQYGAGWWFLDQKEGIEMQLNALSNLGLLGRFVGMLTDSRSLLSYPRHEYFRRILCNLIGEDVSKGELPDDMELLGDLVTNICYKNAKEYFEF